MIIIVEPMHLVGSMVGTHKLLVKQFLGQFASTGLAILAGRPFQLRSKTVVVFSSLILLKHLAAIVDTVEHKFQLSNSAICGCAAHVKKFCFTTPAKPWCGELEYNYRMCAIISRGLYIFYPIFH